jgi:uncharacterized membrane protein YfcA
MMGGCAFLQLTDGIPLARSRKLDLSLLAAMTVGAVPGVLVAAFVVRSLPLASLRWMVVVVVSITALTMFRALLAQRRSGSAVSAEAALP